ncbi:MAG: hypothetical protein DMF57_16800 [Acidobacteria bacterium]|nr:MAG: hypothetical protein DMF57_16800 [Acidobacteriota bacterium]
MYWYLSHQVGSLVLFVCANAADARRHVMMRDSLRIRKAPFGIRDLDGEAYHGRKMSAVRDIRSLFADYASYHRTSGNKAFHRIGIPLIMLSLLGMLARVPVAGPVDAAILLIVVAEVVYLILDWRLGAIMLVVSALFYYVGALLPLWLNVALFVIGWILQFVGHSVYEKRQPAFFKNALHLLVGPLWILNDLVPVVKV